MYFRTQGDPDKPREGEDVCEHVWVHMSVHVCVVDCGGRTLSC